MSTAIYDFVWQLLGATLAMTAAAGAAYLGLRVLRLQSAAWQKTAWVLVLLQGLILVRLVVVVPWLEPLAVSNALMPATPDATPDRPHATADAHHNRASSQPSAKPNLPQWPRAVLTVWLLGALVMVAKSAWCYYRFVTTLDARLCERSDWLQELSESMAALRLARPISLLVSKDTGPLLCRLPRGSAIIVPQGIWQNLTSQQRVAVLCHELVHRARGDLWQSLLVRLIALPHWFNPAAWISVDKIEEAMEWSADDTVLRTLGETATMYAKTLLDVGDARHYRPGWQAAVGRGSLTARIRRLLNRDETVQPHFMPILLVIALAACLMPRIVRVELVAQETNDQQAPRKPTAASALGAAQAKKPTRQVSREEYLRGTPMGHAVRDPRRLPDLRGMGSLILVGPRIHDKHLREVGRLDDLLLLTLYETSVKGRGLAHFRGLHKLTQVAFVGPGVTDDWLRNVPTLESLQWFTLSGSDITSEGLEELKRFPNVHSVQVGYTQIDDRGMEVLGQLTGIKILDLVGTQITDEGLANLERLQKLESLSLGHMPLKGTGLAHLRHCPELKSLDLLGREVTNEWLDSITALSKVEWLQIYETSVSDEGMDFLRDWTQLKKLYISHNPIGDGAVPHLANLFRLETIDLTGTRFTAEGVRQLREALPDANVIPPQPQSP